MKPLPAVNERISTLLQRVAIPCLAVCALGLITAPASGQPLDRPPTEPTTQVCSNMQSEATADEAAEDECAGTKVTAAVKARIVETAEPYDNGKNRMKSGIALLLLGGLSTAPLIIGTGAMWADGGEADPSDFYGNASSTTSEIAAGSLAGAAGLGAIVTIVGSTLLMTPSSDQPMNDVGLRDAGIALTDVGIAAMATGGLLLAFGLGRGGQGGYECVEQGEGGLFTPSCSSVRVTDLPPDDNLVIAGGIVLGGGAVAVAAGLALFGVGAATSPGEGDAPNASSSTDAAHAFPEVLVAPTGGSFRWTF